MKAQTTVAQGRVRFLLDVAGRLYEATKLMESLDEDSLPVGCMEAELLCLELIEGKINRLRDALQKAICPCCGCDPHKMSCYPEMRAEKSK